MTIDTTPPKFTDWTRPECTDRANKDKKADPCGKNPANYDVNWKEESGAVKKLEASYQGSTDTIASMHKAVDGESPILK